MSFLTTLYELISNFTSWMWGIPVLIILIGGGVILSIIIGGVQFTRAGFIFKNTLGSALKKEDKADKEEDGITPLQGMIAALSATVGTGNIVGVGVAIAVGGPGALFWIWIAGFLAMAIKFGEVTMSCKYRQPDGHGGFKGGPYMYIKDGLNQPYIANFFGIMMLVCLTVICGVHASSITSNLGILGVPSGIAAIIMIAFVILVIWGGMNALVKITDKMVPFMSILYIVVSLIIVFANISQIGTVFVSVFKGAFTGWAAVGGFTGAAFSNTIRIGLARGVFSNDAGLGLSASVQAQVKNIGHPAKQGMWAVIETFIDTIIICTLSGLVVLFTGVWQSGGDGSTFITEAFGSVLGNFGSVLAVISLFLFGLSSMITDAQGVKIQAISMFNSVKVGSLFQIAIILLIIGGSMSNISTAFVFVDFSNGIILFVNIAALMLLHKTLRATTKEWFDNNGDLEAISRVKNSN